MKKESKESIAANIYGLIHDTGTIEDRLDVAGDPVVVITLRPLVWGQVENGLKVIAGDKLDRS